jgi:hypothetical protein
LELRDTPEAINGHSTAAPGRVRRDTQRGTYSSSRGTRWRWRSVLSGTPGCTHTRVNAVHLPMMVQTRMSLGASPFACVRLRRCACTVRLCGPSRGTAATGGINSSALGAAAAVCACLRSAPPAGVALVGRRGFLGEPYRCGAMGCATCPHVRNRRFRHHLRPWRLWMAPPLPGRVDEHRRRCAAGLGQGVVGGNTKGVLKGCSRVLEG